MDRQTVLFTCICSQGSQVTENPRTKRATRDRRPWGHAFWSSVWLGGPQARSGNGEKCSAGGTPISWCLNPSEAVERGTRGTLLSRQLFVTRLISSSPLPKNTGEFARPSPDANIYLGLSFNESHFGIYWSNILDYFSKLPFKCKLASLSFGPTGLGSAYVRWLVSLDRDNFKALCKYRSYGVAPRLFNVQWHAPETSGFGMFF